MKVVDLSDWQEGIDFDSLMSDYEGVIIKISEGTRKTKQFENYMSEIERLGVPWGVYCFCNAYTPDQSTIEASCVIEYLSGRTPTLGIWYDIEDEDEVADWATGVEDATGRVSAFISYCNSCGYSAGVYSNSGTFVDGYVEVNSLADYVPYWVADFSGSNDDFTNSFPNSHVAGWQYSSTRVTPYWQWGLDSSIFY